MSSKGKKIQICTAKKCNPGPAFTDRMPHTIGRLSDGVLAVHSSRPRKRSANTMAPQGASQNGQTQAFFFVDPASSTREKRAHVMRHHIQAKRKQTMQATHTDRQSRREPRVYPWTKKPGGNEAEPNARPIHSAIPAVST